jgi:hypothetical protein
MSAFLNALGASAIWRDCLRRGRDRVSGVSDNPTLVVTMPTRRDDCSPACMWSERPMIVYEHCVRIRGKTGCSMVENSPVSFGPNRQRRSGSATPSVCIPLRSSAVRTSCRKGILEIDGIQRRHIGGQRNGLRFLRAAMKVSRTLYERTNCVRFLGLI